MSDKQLGKDNLLSIEEDIDRLLKQDKFRGKLKFGALMVLLFILVSFIIGVTSSISPMVKAWFGVN